MDGPRFDSLARLFAATRSRRAALRSAVGATALGVAGLSLLNVAGTEAKKNKGKRRRKKKKTRVCLEAGASCSNSAECCPDTTQRTCGPANNEMSAARTCCGGVGAICGGLDNQETSQAPFCCQNFGCNKTTKLCQSLPPE